MADFTLYHNPQCGTSRTTLAYLQDTGKEVEVVEYLKTPPSRKKLAELVKRSGGKVRDFIRTKGGLYEELGLDEDKWSDDELLDTLAEHPMLLNRPVVEAKNGVRVCRPADKVFELIKI